MAATKRVELELSAFNEAVLVRENWRRINTRFEDIDQQMEALEALGFTNLALTRKPGEHSMGAASASVLADLILGDITVNSIVGDTSIWNTPRTNVEGLLEQARRRWCDALEAYTTASKSVGSGQHAYVAIPDGVTTNVHWNIEVPPVVRAAGASNTLTYTVVWYQATAVSSTVRWILRMDAMTDGGAIATSVVNDTLDATEPNAANTFEHSSATTSAIDWTTHDFLSVTFKRDGAADASTTAARLMGVLLRWDGDLDIPSSTQLLGRGGTLGGRGGLLGGRG